MNKQLCIVSMLLLNLSNVIYADFVAFRKLTDPKTNNVVYLLYDLHATIDSDPKSTEKLIEKITTLNTEEIKKGDKKAKNLETIQYENFKKITVPKIEKIFDEIREKNFKNLAKQHEDLLNIVRTYQISLINEDWPKYGSESKSTGINFNNLITMDPKKYSIDFYIEQNIGHDKNYKNFIYWEGVSPMLNISKKLIGKFTYQEFEKIKNTDTAYFFNPDERFCRVDMSGEQCLKINTDTLKALNELFTTYKQKKIIIAEGADHIVAIAHELITKKGYKAGELIISDALKKQRENNSIIDAKIKSFKENKKSDVTLTDEATYYLVDQPIDLKAIFEKEFKQKNEIKKENKQEEDKQKENRPSLDVEAMKRRSDLIGKTSKLLKRADALRPQEKIEIRNLRNDVRNVLKSIQDKKNNEGISPENYTIFMQKLTELEEKVSEFTLKDSVDTFAQALQTIK